MQEEDRNEEAGWSNPLDTRTRQLDDELSKRLEYALEQAPQFALHEISKIASEYDPIDLAHAVSHLPPQARVIVYENLPDLNANIIFMANTANPTRTAIFRQIDDQEIKELVERMPPDEAVELLDDLSDRRLKRVLELIDPKKATRIRELYRHDRHSAGRLMTNEFFAFRMNMTIGEVAGAIRNNPGIDLTRRIFVLNDQDALIGYVPDRMLIVNPPYVPIRQVMRPVLHWIRADASRDEVVDLVERYKVPALPVVDEEERLVGVITYERVVDALEDIADETIASIAGTAEEVGEDEPAIKRFFGRAPWLIVTLCAGLVTATALSHFKDSEWFNVVALFVPLIAGMSGNVGIQCSTILVRGLSTGEISLSSRREAITKELSIGAMIGVVFGILCGSFVYLLNKFGFHGLQTSPVIFGLIVGLGLLGACFVATLLGTLSPFVFARFRIDPAVASGPIVTAFNDVLSTLMYIMVAKFISSLFAI